MIDSIKYVLIFLWALTGFSLLADPAVSPIFIQRAEQEYGAARVRYRAQPTNTEAAWQMGRACYDRADLSIHDKERAALAQEGILACRQAVLDDPNSAFAHYYLAINLGELASARGLGALRVLREMEEEWETTARLDETIDSAGPDRCLGMLFRDAPNWPISIGSRAKAIQYLTRAARLCPKFPDNQLTLAEAYLQWSDFDSARSVATEISEVFKQARHDLTGPAWESSWVDWTRRWAAIETRLNDTNHSHSPHVVK